MAVKQTNPMFYLAALLIFLGAWVAGFIIAAGDWNQIDSREIRTLNPNDPIDVGDDGIALFTNTADTNQATCREADDRLKLESPGFDLATERGDTTWHLLTVSRDAEPGTYRIDCAPRGTNARYGHTALPDFRGATIGNGVGSVGTLVAVILAIWTYVRRRRYAKGNQ